MSEEVGKFICGWWEGWRCFPFHFPTAERGRETEEGEGRKGEGDWESWHSSGPRVPEDTSLFGSGARLGHE